MVRVLPNPAPVIPSVIQQQHRRLRAPEVKKKHSKDEPLETSCTFEDQSETAIPEIYDNEQLETNIPVGPVTRPKTRRNVSFSEIKQIRQFTHCDNHAVQFTPSPSKFIAPSLTKNLPSTLSTTEKFAQYTSTTTNPSLNKYSKLSNRESQ